MTEHSQSWIFWDVLSSNCNYLNKCFLPDLSHSPTCLPPVLITASHFATSSTVWCPSGATMGFWSILLLLIEGGGIEGEALVRPVWYRHTGKANPVFLLVHLHHTNLPTGSPLPVNNNNITNLRSGEGHLPYHATVTLKLMPRCWGGPINVLNFGKMEALCVNGSRVQEIGQLPVLDRAEGFGI